MPKGTFYRIPEEKQKRILDAARQQFLSVPYREVSINKIIKQAEIPRGSFYQYFEDKEDLFRFVLQESKNNLFGILAEEIEKSNGDIFQCMENHVDRIVEIVYHDESGKMQMLFSESWIFETILMAVINEKECDGETSLSLLDKIDRSILDVEDEEELALMVSILSAVARDSIGKIFLHKDMDEMQAKRMFKAKVRTLKKHYSRKE